jgi:hypothetical protein
LLEVVVITDFGDRLVGRRALRLTKNFDADSQRYGSRLHHSGKLTSTDYSNYWHAHLFF